MSTNIAEKLEAFFTRFKHQRYKKGEILIRADETPLGIFYLQSGRVKEYAISKKGEELVINIFKPASFFPMSWGINNTANNYYYEAITAVEVWRAPKEKVIEFLKNNPDVLFDLLSRVYRGADGLLMRMVYLMGEGVYARLITELIMYAKRFGKKENGKTEIQISEKDLASQTGMTRETVSRELSHLKNKGLITFNKRLLTIMSLNKLEEELL